jgi:hypothetical protein
VEDESGVMAEEVWQPAPEGFSRYDVSSEGRVRSYAITGPTPGLRRATPKLMTLHTRPDGYVQVKLSHDDGGSVTIKVHRLVLLTFIGNPPRGDDGTLWAGSHMDGTKDRNVVSNLCWEPQLANVRRQVPGGTRIGNRRRGEAHHSTPLTADDVRAIRRAYRPGVRGHGASVIAKRYGISKQAVQNILARKTWAHVEDEAA